MLASDAPPLERSLTALYPALDFLLLIPLLILVRITAPFLGGRVFHAWGLLLAGMISQSAGDILYAYVAAMGWTVFDPAVDATLLFAYVLTAAGMAEHRRLLGR